MSEAEKGTNPDSSGILRACPGRDAEILLIAHGGLSLPAFVSTKAHLMVCAACRERHETFTGVSEHVAMAIRTPLLPKWTPYSRSFPGKMMRLPWITALLFLLSLVAIFVHHSAGAASKPNMCAHSQSKLVPQVTGKCPLHLHKSQTDNLPH